MLFEPTQPVPAAPPGGGLLAAAVTDLPAPRHWGNGLAWRPERCPSATPMQPHPCGGGSMFGPAVGEGDDGIVYHHPQAFRVDETCAYRGGDRDPDRVRRQALAVTSFMVARELETGLMSRLNPYDTPNGPAQVNAHLASSDTVVIPGTWDPIAGLGELEQVARADAGGMDVMIHMPVAYVPLMRDALVERGRVLYTKTGARVAADAGYSGGGALTAGTSEVQTVTITGGPTGGSFTLTYDGETTGPIAYNATAAAVQAELAGLPNTSTGLVTVTGAAGGPYTLTFDADYGDVPQVTADDSGLTGGVDPAVGVATTTPGVAPGRAAGDWLYATGLVGVLLDEIVVNRIDVHAENRFIRTADRLFATLMDPCNQHALAITVPPTT